MPNREIYDRFSSISCSPSHINKLYQELAASQAEVERLRSQLKRAVEIAEEFWNNQKQAVTVYHGELADELAALKEKIK